MNAQIRAWYVLSLLIKIIKTQKFDLNDLTNLSEDVQKFHLSRSIFIIYNKRQYGFEDEKLLLDTIKRHQHFKFQVITYHQLEKVSKLGKNNLHVVLIHDAHDLESAIKATKNVEMSLYPWLLYFTRNSTFDCNRPPKHFFKIKMNTKMMAKCEANTTLKKYHSVIDGQTEVIDLAEWSSSEKKLKFIDTAKLTKIETDMKGITLKLARRVDSIEEANKQVADFRSHLMSEFEYLGNFKTNVTIRKSTAGFYDDKTHCWSGLMKVLHEGKADIGMFLFSMSKSSLNVVDFATPINRNRYFLYARLPERKNVLWSAYFKVFDLYTWLMIGSSILVVSVILILTGYRRQGHGLRDPAENFLLVLGIYCQQGIVDFPLNVVTRIIYFSILISSFVLYAIYSGSITSYVANLSAKLPFDTYEEFKFDTSYKVSILRGSHNVNFILGDDKYFWPLKFRLKLPYEWPADPHEGFEQACEEKTVFYSNDGTFYGLKYSPSCQLGQVDMNQVEYTSFILKKNSPYTKIINHFIARLREHGILRRLKNKYFYKYTELPKNQPNVITLHEALPIIALWVFGVIMALIVWIFEMLVFHLF